MATYPFVLVPGVCHGGWCWQRVARLLRAAGHEVFSLSQTGVGERAHLLAPSVGLDTFITDLLNLVCWEELEGIVLVGHSFGGMAISGVADRIPERIRRIIYIDAVVPQPGQSALGMLTEDVAKQRLQQAQQLDGGISFPAPPAASFGITAPADIAWVERRLTPHPVKTYTDAIHLERPAATGLPRTYIHCTDPPYPFAIPIAERIRAEAGWRYRELATGHDAMITAPADLTALLLEP